MQQHDKKDQVVHVRITRKEKKFIEAAARAKNRTISDYVRILAVGTAKQELPAHEIAQIALEDI